MTVCSQGLKKKQSVVVFDFIKNSNEEVSVQAGQVVDVLEKDDGSGWVKVTDGINEGLMPASYINFEEI